MAVARKRQKMKRTQICLLPEQFDKASRIAKRRGGSVSEVIRDLLENAPEADIHIDDPLRDLIGMFKDGDPDGSTKIDEVLYGSDIHR